MNKTRRQSQRRDSGGNNKRRQSQRRDSGVNKTRRPQNRSSGLNNSARRVAHPREQTTLAPSQRRDSGVNKKTTTLVGTPLDPPVSTSEPSRLQEDEHPRRRTRRNGISDINVRYLVFDRFRLWDFDWRNDCRPRRRPRTAPTTKTRTRTLANAATRRFRALSPDHGTTASDGSSTRAIN